MQKEIWKDVPNYEGIYKVSNIGRIKSMERLIVRNKCGRLLINEKILKPHIGNNGYETVVLYKNKIKSTKSIHRIVGLAFVSNPKNKPQINHIDGIKTSNSISNLEWCTSSENTKHAYSIGLMSRKGKNNSMYGKKGKDNPSSKPVFQFDLDGNIINRFESTRIAGSHTCVSNQNISKVCNGERITAGGFMWKHDTNQTR